jgi:hypothetical protein
MAAMPSGEVGSVSHVIPDAPGFAIAAFQPQGMLPGCQYSVGGSSWDLSSLYRSSGDYKGTDGTYDYKMNVCGVSNSGAGCTDKQYSICQFSQAGGTFVASLGSFSAQPPTWSVITIPPNPPEAAANGVQYVMTNGDICWIAGRQQVRTVINVFRCHQGATPDAVKVEEDQTTCTFTITLETAIGCPGGGGGGGGGGSSGGISGGSVFLIILFSIIPIYIAAGCLYGRTKKGLTGVEAAPHIEFWRGLPGLIKDGARYSWNMTRSGCKNGTGEAYEKL